MLIQIIPKNHPRGTELIQEITLVVENHPLRDTFVKRVYECLKDMQLKVDMRENTPSTGIHYDRESNNAILYIDLSIYSDKKCREKVLTHEFTHVLDQIDDDFGITEDRRQTALTFQLEGFTNADFKLYQLVWDCYIDGRLEDSCQNPRSLDERSNQLKDMAQHAGGSFSVDVDGILAIAWHSKQLTFPDILNLVQQCSQYWHPNEKG